MDIMMDESLAEDWFKGILPQIREAYSCKVAFAGIPYGEQWEYLDERGMFAGYDCVGITIFPRKDYDGLQDLRGFEDQIGHVEEKARTLNDLGEKYGVDRRFAATSGMGDWYGEAPNAAVLAEGYSFGLDILK